jgi:hypothetical protein
MRIYRLYILLRLHQSLFKTVLSAEKLVVYMYNSLRGVVGFDGRGRGYSDPLISKCVAT